MSMTHVVLPPPRDRVAELQRENETLKTQVRDLNSALSEARIRISSLEAGTGRLRAALTPLYGALQHVFGDLDDMGVEMPNAPANSGIDSRQKAIWDSWKQKLDPQAGKAIEALLTHGALNQTQLRIHIGCAKGSVPGIVFRLNKAGLIDKNGGKISLKEL